MYGRPPLVHDWSEANAKRDTQCRVCRRSDRKIELAHVIGITHDSQDAVEKPWPLRGKLRACRVATVKADRVVPLCGPSVNNGTCHHAHDYTTGEVELWDHLTEAEKKQAVIDAGSLGQAIHRCAPRTWEDRLDWDSNGDLIELAI